MKKYLLLILFLIIILPVYADDTGIRNEQNNTKIEDELLKSKHFYKKIKPYHLKNKTPITDELLEPKSYKNSLFRLSIYKHGKFKQKPINDELINDEFINNAGNTVLVRKEKPDDYFIEKRIDTRKVRRISAKNKYDFTKKQIPIRIKVSKHLKSTKNISEGSTIPFIAVHDFEIMGKKFNKGTTVFGRVETISDSDKMGVPECIKIDNFFIEDENKTEINLYGSVSKTGANRSIWVYPLYQAGNICLYAAGFVFVPIHGGRAKVMTTETFTVFYETQ